MTRAAASSLTAHALFLGGLAVWAGKVFVLGGAADAPVPSLVVDAAVALDLERLPPPAASSVAPEAVEPALVPAPLERDQPERVWSAPLARALPRAAFRRHQVEKLLQAAPAEPAATVREDSRAPPPTPAPAPSAASASGPRVVAGGCPLPPYPRAARRRGLEGVVRLRVSTDAAGAVTAVELVASSGHPILDRAARDAVRDWRLAPARHAGRTVAGQTAIAVRFALRAPRPPRQ